MKQLRLQLMEAVLVLLPLGQIADESDELPLPGEQDLAHRKLHRKRAAVLALADDDPSLADDPALAGREVACQIAVVLAGIRLRHQHADVAAVDFIGREAELAFRGLAEGLHQPALVDDHHRVRNGGQDRPQMRLTPVQLLDQIAHDVERLLRELGRRDRAGTFLSRCGQ